MKHRDILLNVLIFVFMALILCRIFSVREGASNSEVKSVKRAARHYKTAKKRYRKYGGATRKNEMDQKIIVFMDEYYTAANHSGAGASIDEMIGKDIGGEGRMFEKKRRDWCIAEKKKEGNNRGDGSDFRKYQCYKVKRGS